jgi:hypothetical protein
VTLWGADNRHSCALCLTGDSFGLKKKRREKRGVQRQRERDQRIADDLRTQIVEAGFRRLGKWQHPDVGGDPVKMRIRIIEQ